MNFKHVSLATLSLLAITACGGDDAPATTDNDTGSSSESGSEDTLSTTLTADSSSSGVADSSSSESESGTSPPDSSSSDDGPPVMPAEFEVTITNISDTSVLTTDIGRMLWIEQELGTEPVFTPDFADRDEGLAVLASDGDPTELAESLPAARGHVQSGTLKAALAPGEEDSFTFTAEPGDRLSLLAGLGGGNDHFIGTGSLGVALFANNGSPMDMRDISDVLRVWEVGTEYTQAPGQGFDQLGTQAAAGDGMPEAGAVTAFNSSTRALPQAARVISVDVTTDAKTPEVLTITFTNIGDTLASDLSETVWALHEDSVSVFTTGGAASDVAGLEALVEDGDGTDLQATLAAVTGVGSAEVITDATAPGGTFVITVTPDQDNRMLSFVSSIDASNDAFVAPVPGGIALLDEDGSARTNAQIEEDFRRNLIVWDAGTEANEVPGVGANIQSRQLVDDIGDADDDATIRPYSEAFNDLAGPSLGGLLEVTVVEGDNEGEFDVTIENTSGGTAFPAVFSPMLWATHDDSASIFDADMPASPSIEMLAEDGDATALLSDLEGAVADSGVDDGPLGSGASFTFTITPGDDASRLSIAAMLVPSNDTFVSLGGSGVSLLDDKGAPLTADLIEAAIAASLGAWESGTEANQAGAIGRDQAPRQADDNTGANEGNGLVRDAGEDDLIWAWPDADQLIRVTIAPTAK